MRRQFRLHTGMFHHQVSNKDFSSKINCCHSVWGWIRQLITPIFNVQDINRPSNGFAVRCKGINRQYEQCPDLFRGFKFQFPVPLGYIVLVISSLDLRDSCFFFLISIVWLIRIKQLIYFLTFFRIDRPSSLSSEQKDLNCWNYWHTECWDGPVLQIGLRMMPFSR